MMLVFYKPIMLVGRIAVAMHLLQAGRERETLPETEEPMTTVEFITALFCQVDDQMPGLAKHPHASLWPSEVVTLGLVELSRRVTPLDWPPKPCLPVS